MIVLKIKEMIFILPEEGIQQGNKDKFSEKKILDSDCISPKTSVWTNCIFIRKSDFGCKRGYTTGNQYTELSTELSK